MHRGLPMALLLAATVLAGCSGDAGSKKGDDPADLDDFDGLEATDTTGVLRGIVVDSAVRPLAGVNVTATGPGGRLTQATSATGAFGFDDLEPGTYFVSARKPGYNATQTSADVVAGVAEPKLVQILLEANPSEQPYVQDYTYEGFITCGAAIGLTSVGCTTFRPVADQLGDAYIWNVRPDTLPTWAQGELVWDQTQQAGGMFIYEMVKGDTNDHEGYRETGESPALAYWNTTVLQQNNGTVLSDGIDYRVFGGPHPLLAPGGPVLPPREECPDIPVIGFNPCSFGVGLTLNQDFTSYMHMFYNWVPDDGWRFTVDGAPVPPT